MELSEGNFFKIVFLVSNKKNTENKAWKHSKNKTANLHKQADLPQIASKSASISILDASVARTSLPLCRSEGEMEWCFWLRI